MLEIIGGIVVLMCIIYVSYKIFGSKSINSSSPLSNLSENELINKFNGLAEFIGKPGKRNLDNIANELLAVLKEYKCRKVEQFVESEQLLTHNKKHLEEEIAKLNNQIIRLKNDALALKKDNMTDEDYENGALYMAQIDETESVKAKLIETSKKNSARLDEVEKQVKMFNTKYTLKESSINNMIVMAKTTKNISTVDLRLNDLISEFKSKVDDAEIEYKVKAEINGTPDDEFTTPEFNVNKDEYINKFKAMIK